MIDVLFHTFSPIIIHLIKIGNFLYEGGFCQVNMTYELEENLEKFSNMANISKILYS